MELRASLYGKVPGLSSAGQARPRRPAPQAFAFTRAAGLRAGARAGLAPPAVRRRAAAGAAFAARRGPPVISASALSQ